MSHPDYEHIGDPHDKVLEECAEVIQEICKARRFGWFNFHPDDPNRVTNLDRVKREMEDASKAFGKLDAYLTQLSYDHWKQVNDAERAAEAKRTFSTGDPT